jgi:hypothetical protein
MRVSKRQFDRFSEMKKAPGAILPTTRRKPKAAKVTLKEKDIQARAENLCNALGIRFFRIPDALMRYLAYCSDQWVRVFISRYLSGTPDLMLFKPRAEGDNIVRFIEIKTEAGKLSQGQSKWHSGLKVHVCYGWEETEKVIREFQAEGPEASEGTNPPPPPSGVAV